MLNNINHDKLKSMPQSKQAFICITINIVLVPTPTNLFEKWSVSLSHTKMLGSSYLLKKTKKIKLKKQHTKTLQE